MDQKYDANLMVAQDECGVMTLSTRGRAYPLTPTLVRFAAQAPKGAREMSWFCAALNFDDKVVE